MKKVSLVLGTVALFAISSITFTSCSDEAAHENHDHAHATYQCPMTECNDGATFDAPGKCTACGMELKELK